jgi:hypothetical protein
MKAFMKIKSLIENDQNLGKNNEINYIKEFILSKKVDKKYINPRNINNFVNFLKCKQMPIDINISLKDNIILALNYDKDDKNNTSFDKIHNNNENNNNKSISHSLDWKKQKNFINKEICKNDYILRDSIDDEVENKERMIKKIEKNFNSKLFEDNYYIKNLNRKLKITKIFNKELLLMSRKDYYENIIFNNNKESSNKKGKKEKKDFCNLNDLNERLYFLLYKNKKREKIKNYNQYSKLVEYLLFNRAKDKIIENKLMEIAEKINFSNY